MSSTNRLSANSGLRKISRLAAGFCGEISGLAISGLRKKLADSTSFHPVISDSILTNLHLKLLKFIHTGLL
jgi:hypothetical protein